MEFINKKINLYSEKHTEKESEILAELNRETWANVLNPRMLSGHLQGRVLSMISNMIKPKNIIEIGTYTGYSALCMAEGLQKNGKLHTLDINEEYASIAKKYFNRSIYSENIIQHIGKAVDIIPEINLNFQLALFFERFLKVEMLLSNHFALHLSLRGIHSPINFFCLS